MSCTNQAAGNVMSSVKATSSKGSHEALAVWMPYWHAASSSPLLGIGCSAPLLLNALGCCPMQARTCGPEKAYSSLLLLQSAAAAHPALVVFPRPSWFSRIRRLCTWLLLLLLLLATYAAFACGLLLFPLLLLSAACAAAVACGLVLVLPAAYCCHMQLACCSLRCCRCLRPGAVLHAFSSCCCRLSLLLLSCSLSLFLPATCCCCSSLLLLSTSRCCRCRLQLTLLLHEA